ncbi:protein MpGDPDL [Marchantia polymorpha subsp. ruderalis]|nr:glycerophosphodiester phosphodiesterase-like protein [Marchantia polymorpha]PTQ28761.1 hypothetical protein MARPO_0155s0023 [Marchantia polymorpha]BBN19110.1 hypothetical protein Mp_8g07940 [Marchantia polymorpha subsp. ruderalis]|eukprot:PTQ28761.1 hypothetical protein MARPO_0155s0023 [Marchantia polymorpha]
MNRLVVALCILPLLLQDSTFVEAAWKTLNGNSPLVVANGGTSGLYPDQTSVAYQDALNYSLPGVIMSCDLQLVKASVGGIQGICRTNLDLDLSTNIKQVYPDKINSYIVNGVNITGWFTLDISAEDLLTNVSARQSNNARTFVYDSFLLPIFLPDNLLPPYWLNSENASFFEEHGLNMTDYLLATLQGQTPNPSPPDYISSTEVTVLRKLQSDANSKGTKLIFKFLEDKTQVEPTTNQTYGQILGNLSNIATFASGILVPKSYIWETDASTTYLTQQTTLVDDAHKANLEIYAYNFYNDAYPFSYNYSFDPVTEVMHFIEKYNFSVDGVFTDFPTTASEAIACYAESSLNTTASKPVGSRQTVITHNGNSGDYPGCSLPAYTSAIAMGVDYIDCPVQITKDGVLICRESPDLILSTNVASVPNLFQQHLNNYPELDEGSGVYSFDLTWDEINSNLKCNIYSPSSTSGIDRDMANDGKYNIMTLAEFLTLAKNSSVGVFIDIQNAVYIRQKKNLAVVDGVVEAMKAAGYTNPSEKVMLQSEDSSALARLRTLNVSYPLMYRIVYSTIAPVSITPADFVDIKEFATSVSIPKKFIDNMDSQTGFIGGPSQVVQWAHAQNLTAYFFFLRNENTAFVFDYKGDPTLQMYSLAQNYQMDGFVTDYPSSAVNYLGNHCIGNGSTSSNIKFKIPLVEPGLLNNEITGGAPTPAGAPAPDLVVPEPPLMGATSLSPAPAPVPAAASSLPTCLFFSATISFLFHILAVL